VKKNPGRRQRRAAMKKAGVKPRRKMRKKKYGGVK
jgi:hypothetical protein